MKGGAKPYLNLPADVTDASSLKNNMDFIYVSCHGAQDNTLFLVPNNTFIMFRGPSGVSIPLEKTEDELLNKVKYLPDRKGANEANAAKIEAKKDRWWQDTYGDIVSKEFLKKILYKANEPDAPSRTAIYEPGDLIQNIKLQFHNDRPIFFTVGIYELPMRRCVSDDMALLNKKYFEKEKVIITPILKTFLTENHLNDLAAMMDDPDYDYKGLFKMVVDKSMGVPLSDFLRLEFFKRYSDAIKDVRNQYVIQQYNISNCPGRANNKLAELGIGPIPCLPQPGFTDECGSSAASLASLKSALSAGGVDAIAAQYAAVREISLHELVTNRLQGAGGGAAAGGAAGGPFRKKYKFILIEACRALPETYGEQLEYAKYGIPPPSVGFNQAATLELEAKTSAAPSEKAKSLYRSRRYSLNVREPVGGVCFTTLLRLSRERIRLLPPGPIKSKLLSGGLVTNDEVDSVISLTRMVNNAVRALPPVQQFNPLQPVMISSANGSPPRQGVVIAATGKLQTNTPRRDVTYKVRTLTNRGNVQVENIAPALLTRKNAIEGGPNVVKKLTSGNLPFSAPNRVIDPTTVDLIPIPKLGSDKFFRTDSQFRDYLPALERLIDDVPKQFTRVFLKFSPAADFAKQSQFIGDEMIVQDILEPVPDASNPGNQAKVKVKVLVRRVRDDKLLRIDPSLLAVSFEEAKASIPVSVPVNARPVRLRGGGRGKSRSMLAGKFCRCIKQVRRTVKPRGKNKSVRAKESAAIGICTRSLLQQRGRTLRKFKCGTKPMLETQDRKK